MTIELLRETLLWCTLINFGVLVIWGLMIMFLRDFVFGLHGKLFKINEEQFNAIHYGGMTFYKLIIIMFNFVPYLALLIVGE